MEECPNNACNTFVSIYKKAFENSFPLKTIKLIKRYTIREPWVTKGIIVSSLNKEKLFHKKLKKPTEIKINTYKKCLTIFNRVKRNAKQKYFETILYENKNNIKETWSILRKIINNQERK